MMLFRKANGKVVEMVSFICRQKRENGALLSNVILLVSIIQSVDPPTLVRTIRTIPGGIYPSYGS